MPTIEYQRGLGLLTFQHEQNQPYIPPTGSNEKRFTTRRKKLIGMQTDSFTYTDMRKSAQLAHAECTFYIKQEEY